MSLRRVVSLLVARSHIQNLVIQTFWYYRIQYMRALNHGYLYIICLPLLLVTRFHNQKDALANILCRFGIYGLFSWISIIFWVLVANPHNHKMVIQSFGNQFHIYFQALTDGVFSFLSVISLTLPYCLSLLDCIVAMLHLSVCF